MTKIPVLYWGTGSADKLAAGFKDALDQLGKGGAARPMK
jgi:hypothetical protein